MAEDAAESGGLKRPPINISGAKFLLAIFPSSKDHNSYSELQAKLSQINCVAGMIAPFAQGQTRTTHMNVSTFTLRRLGAIEQALLLLSATCSAAYFVSKSWQPFPGSVALKGLCIAPLAVVAVRLMTPPNSFLLGGALAFSTLGDVFLDWGGRFVPGLGAFLVAHLFYIALFVRNGERPVEISGNQSITLAALAFFSLALTLWLWPGLGALAVPVLCYIGALTLMVATAILGRFRQSWIVWGALLFLISDSLIGINRFKTPVPLRDHLVWATYYLGQCGIALGFLREQD